jgi:Na+/H+-dicarboxylate symporter
VRLHLAIALGLVAGLVLGLAAAASGSPALLAIAQGVEPVGTVFVNLLKMVVIPLVVAVIFVGVCRLGDLRRLGRLGGLTIFFFLVTSVASVLIGMGIMRLLLPLASAAAEQAVAGTVQAAPLPGPVEFLVNLIPSNPFQAAADGALLPLIVFTAFAAAATGTLPAEPRDRLLHLADALTAALIKIVHWILILAPIGVFALAAPVTARAGWAILQSLAAFVLAVLIGLVCFVAVVYVPAVRFLGGTPGTRFLRACVAAQVIAATTTSSAATVPAMLEAADSDLRLSAPVLGFVIPLGAAIGRAGSALFQGAAIVFLAWLYRVPIPATALVGAVGATVLVSLTVAGVPGGSVLSLAPALGTVGIPLDGMAVLLGVDRIPDMVRTATNVTGTLAAAVVLDRLEGNDPNPPA